MLRIKKTLGGSEGMLPGKFTYCSAHFTVVLFEQILGKFCLKFLPLILSVAPNMMHFVCTFWNMRAQGVRIIVIEKVRNYGKVVFIKNMFENGWWGGGFSTKNFKSAAMAVKFASHRAKNTLPAPSWQIRTEQDYMQMQAM